MNKQSVLTSLRVWGVSYKQLTKAERSEKFFPRIALLCHSEKFSAANDGKGFYLTGNNWQEVYDLFLKYYVSEYGTRGQTTRGAA